MPCAPWQCPAKKMKNSPEIEIFSMDRKSCCSLLLRWFRHDSDNYQTGIDWILISQLKSSATGCKQASNVRNEFAATPFFFAAADAVILWAVQYKHCEYLFITELNNVHSLHEYLLTTILSEWILHGSLSLVWQFASCSSWV